MRGRATAVAIGLVTIGLTMAAMATGAKAHDGANHVDVPTWENPYRWPGHGYAGWVSSVSAPDPTAYGAHGARRTARPLDVAHR